MRLGQSFTGPADVVVSPATGTASPAPATARPAGATAGRAPATSGPAPTTARRAATGPTSGARVAMTFTRQRTSRSLLAIDWRYPKSLELGDDFEGTRAGARMTALPRDEVLRIACDGDPRPLLVLRECEACNGTEDALLSTKLDNEKTRLLTRWFRCIKLRPNVLLPDHTFHALFDAPHPPHLFLCMPDGTNLIPLDGKQSQTMLWKAMAHLLGLSYEKDPEEAVKNLRRLMERYDHLDAAEDSLREQLEKEVEAHGPKSAKVQSLEAKLQKLRAEREQMKAEEAKAADLGLRDRAPKAG